MALCWFLTTPAAWLAVTVLAGGWYVAATGQWWPLALGLGLLALAVGGWCESRKVRSWGQLTEAVEAYRRLRRYRAGWEDAMDGAKLVRADVVPTLEAVTLDGRRLDVLTVTMAPGQLVADWRAVADRLASTWDRRLVRVRPVARRADQVQLFVHHHGAAVALPHPPAFAAGPDEQEDTVTELPAPRPATGAFPRTPRGAA
jgi:hypothetical protein